MRVPTEIRPIMSILLAAIARECNVEQDSLSVEIEQVVLNALLAAYDANGHARPTDRHPPNPNLLNKTRKPRGTFKP